MKRLPQFLLALCFPLILSSCEEGLFGPRQPNCLETEQVNNSGQSTQRIYDGNAISEIRFFTNEVPTISYRFSYDNKGRITHSQYVNETNGTLGTLEIISYAENGKREKSTISHPNGSMNTFSVQYDDQNQVKSYTSSSTNAAGTQFTNYTITYDWEGGNNTRLTYTSPSLHQVIAYEFDLNRPNNRRKEQEKVAFLSNTIAHNKNMYKRVTTTSTNPTTSATSTSVSDYNYQYNEQGYPVRLTRTASTNSGTPSTFVTDFFYLCN